MGKTTNGQALVSLASARDEVPVGVALRLFLPAVWTDDPARWNASAARCATHRTEGEIALEELSRNSRGTLEELSRNSIASAPPD